MLLVGGVQQMLLVGGCTTNDVSGGVQQMLLVGGTTNAVSGGCNKRC